MEKFKQVSFSVSPLEGRIDVDPIIAYNYYRECHKDIATALNAIWTEKGDFASVEFILKDDYNEKYNITYYTLIYR